MTIESETAALETLDDSDRDPLEREAAGHYLNLHPREQIIPRLVAALRDDDEGVRHAAAEGLIKLGVTAWPDLLLALMDAKSAGDPRLQRGAHHVLHHSPLAPAVTAQLVRELQVIPTADVSAMIEADRLYRRMLSNETFAARVAALHRARRVARPAVKECKPMDIPLDVDVLGAGEFAGHSRMVIIDPTKRQVTHVVVEEENYPFAERLVPLDWVQECTPELMHLRCTRQEWAELEPYVEVKYLQPNVPYLSYMTGDYALWPYFPTPDPASIAAEHFQLPPGELAISRGTRVEALDGHVGQVDEFLVNRETGQITHLVLHEGHLWGQKDVTIPVGQIGHIAGDTVFLKLDKHGIEGLPAIQVRWKMT